MVNGNFVIVGLTFEEYLVSTYYMELLHFEGRAAEGLDEYTPHLYGWPADLLTSTEMKSVFPKCSGVTRCLRSNRDTGAG